MSTRTEIEFLEEENHELREKLAHVSDRLENLALALEMSATTTAPSKKSEIENGCASAIRQILLSVPIELRTVE